MKHSTRGLGLGTGEGTAVEVVDTDRKATPLMGVPVVAQAHRILVVEDDEACASSLSAFLTEEGFMVATAATGTEALAAARKQAPDLVILDVGLPDVDGFDVASQLARDRRLASVPVLFASALHDLPSRIRQRGVPGADFVQKPFRGDELMARVERAIEDAAKRGQLRRDAYFDDLTGLGNVRLLEERLQVEQARIARYQIPLSVVLADLDGLKRINDTHGHLAGSAVLCAVGEAIRAEIRETDVAVRYGGDEFVVLLPHTKLEAGVQFAERLLARLRSLRAAGVTVSMSMGVGAFDPTLDSSLRALIERADAAAYRVKRRGGNGIEITKRDARPTNE